MFSQDGLNALLDQVLAQLGHGTGFSNQDALKTGGGDNKDNCDDSKDGSNKLQVTPAQAVVIGGLFTGVLSIQSVLINKNQVVEIVLAGSLKRRNVTDKLFDQLGPMPLDEILRAIGGRF